MNCPQCDVELVTLEGEETVSVCESCSGLWMEVGGLNRVLLHHNLGGLESLGGRVSKEGSDGICRDCQLDLTRIENKGEFYETCEGCGNVFVSVPGTPASSEKEAIVMLVDTFRAFAGR